MKKVVLVDFSNFCYAVYYSAIYVLNNNWDGEIQPKEKMLYNMALGKIHKIKDAIKNIDKFYFILDAGRGNKMDLLDNYKGNRKKLEINPILILGKKLVKDYKFKYAMGEEADDCIATICRKNEDKDIMTIVVTADQDMWQLSNKKVKIFHTNKLEYATKEKLKYKYGLKDWAKIVDYKVIFGDSSDNIQPIVKRLRRKPIIDMFNKGLDCKAVYKELKKKYDVSKKEIDKRIEAIELRRKLKVEKIKDKKQIIKVIKFKNKSN